MTRRVVITGMGTVNALSCDLQAFWRALCAGRSGVGPIEQLDTTAFKVKFGGEVKGFTPEDVIEPKTARADWLPAVGLDAPPRGNGVAVTLMNDKGEPLAALIAGKSEDIGDPSGAIGLFVRKPDREPEHP